MFKGEIRMNIEKFIRNAFNRLPSAYRSITTEEEENGTYFALGEVISGSPYDHNTGSRTKRIEIIVVVDDSPYKNLVNKMNPKLAITRYERLNGKRDISVNIEIPSFEDHMKVDTIPVHLGIFTDEMLMESFEDSSDKDIHYISPLDEVVYNIANTMFKNRTKILTSNTEESKLVAGVNLDDIGKSSYYREKLENMRDSAVLIRRFILDLLTNDKVANTYTPKDQNEQVMFPYSDTSLTISELSKLYGDMGVKYEPLELFILLEENNNGVNTIQGGVTLDDKGNFVYRVIFRGYVLGKYVILDKHIDINLSQETWELEKVIRSILTDIGYLRYNTSDKLTESKEDGFVFVESTRLSEFNGTKENPIVPRGFRDNDSFMYFMPTTISYDLNNIFRETSLGRYFKVESNDCTIVDGVQDIVRIDFRETNVKVPIQLTDIYRDGYYGGIEDNNVMECIISLPLEDKTIRTNIYVEKYDDLYCFDGVSEHSKRNIIGFIMTYLHNLVDSEELDSTKFTTDIGQDFNFDQIEYCHNEQESHGFTDHLYRLGLQTNKYSEYRMVGSLTEPLKYLELSKKPEKTVLVLDVDLDNTPITINEITSKWVEERPKYLITQDSLIEWTKKNIDSKTEEITESMKDNLKCKCNKLDIPEEISQDLIDKHGLHDRGELFIDADNNLYIEVK